MKENPMNGARPLLTNARLCQAPNRTGMPCRCPVMRGKSRCRLHGGAKDSGGPKCKGNGMWKHGGYTIEAVALRQAAKRLICAIEESK